MGMMTDRAIENWQRNAGIKPATGERAEVLRALQKAAFEAIRIIELEHSGIRDGDGYWHGGDVIGGFTDNLIVLCERLMGRHKDPAKSFGPQGSGDFGAADDGIPW